MERTYHNPIGGNGFFSDLEREYEENREALHSKNVVNDIRYAAYWSLSDWEDGNGLNGPFVLDATLKHLKKCNEYRQNRARPIGYHCDEWAEYHKELASQVADWLKPSI